MLINWLLRLVLGKRYAERKRYGLPKYVRKIWYNGRAHGLNNSNGFYPYIFIDDPVEYKRKYIDAQVGLLCKVGETKDGKSIYYQIISINRKRGGDWLYPSDNIDVDLQFSYITGSIFQPLFSKS